MFSWSLCGDLKRQYEMQEARSLGDQLFWQQQLLQQQQFLLLPVLSVALLIVQ
jgi:hypothetical protein